MKNLDQRSSTSRVRRISFCADALSRLPRESEHFVDTITLDHLFVTEMIQETEQCLPLLLSNIKKHQEKQDFKNRIKNWKIQITRTPFGTTQIFCDDKKRFLIPKSLQLNLIEYHHDMLIHPGITKQNNTMTSIVFWPNMLKDITTYIKNCELCSLSKRNRRSYGHLPATEQVIDP